MHETTLKKFIEAEKLYLQGNYSITKLSKRYNFNRYKFSNYLKNKNINVINKHNQCKFNENIFDVVNTEEKAYWLGFLFADGYVSKRDNQIELSLKLSDKDHLEKFKQFLQWSGNVKTDIFRCRIGITNKHLKTTLISYGCTPNKSLILKYPNKDIMEEKLWRHFIRGYFDGDGCIHVHPNKNNCCIILIGTVDFITSLLNNVSWKQNKIQHDIRHNPQTVYIRYAGNTAISILKELYNNATVYLDRKYNKYKEFAVLYGNI